MRGTGLRIGPEVLAPDLEASLATSHRRHVHTSVTHGHESLHSNAAGDRELATSQYCLMSLESVTLAKLDFSIGLTFEESSKISPEGLRRRIFFSTVITFCWDLNHD